MNLTRQAKFGLWAFAAVVIAAASYFVGTTLKPGEEPYYLYNTQAAAYDAPSAIAATSPGGFTGFGETDGSDSRVVLSGRVIDITGDTPDARRQPGPTDAVAVRRLAPHLPPRRGRHRPAAARRNGGRAPERRR